MPFKSCSFCQGISYQDEEAEIWECPYCETDLSKEVIFNPYQDDN